MQGSPTPLSVLGSQADTERQRIRQQFETGTSAPETLRAQCELADRNVQQIFDEVLRVQSREPQGLCLLALGGYGRRMLFPYSDLDILFLLGNERIEQESRPLISEFSRTLWDIGFRVSSAGRTLEECKRIEEDNAEFHLALLDRRFLAGDAALFEKLDAKVLPASEKQARPFLLAQIHRLTRERLTRYGNTIFHLEPNVKESPGGMRDYQATIWLRQIVEEKRGIRNVTAAEEELSAAAVDFLSAIRCFLHYSNARNDNTLTYELQAAAAERGLGVGDGVARTPAEWMRQYFRHARTLNRQLLRYLEQTAPVPSTLRQRFFNAARTAKFEPGGHKFFAVRDGLLVVRDFYHRYTVDEHSLRTIEHLQELAEPPDERGAHFGPLWKTAERRDLLILTLLLHDVGKGMSVENHVTGGLTALASAAKRLNLSSEEKEEVHFLIEHHLDMSATVQRRDIFDPATVSAFAQSVTTLERLQRLCLLTYADIHSVNPEALTPWKAEMLWQQHQHGGCVRECRRRDAGHLPLRRSAPHSGAETQRG